MLAVVLVLVLAEAVAVGFSAANAAVESVLGAQKPVSVAGIGEKSGRLGAVCAPVTALPPTSLAELESLVPGPRAGRRSFAAMATAAAHEWSRKDLVGLQDLSKEEITLLLDTAQSFEPISTRSLKKAAALRGKVVVNLFFENSTRTANSFALAAQRLSADVLHFHTSASSVSKGETLLDTARNIEAMGVDAFVMRHHIGGTPHFLARNIEACVINAGDGAHEHPTQGLLDIYTIRKKFGQGTGRNGLNGLKVAVVGDIRHSRVARSNAWGLRKLGAEVWFVGPPTLLPRGIECLDVKLCSDLDKALRECDVINLLRVQLERAAGNFFPSISEYAGMYGVSEARLLATGREHMIMHPGPINRGIEIQPEVADGKSSVILQQVAHGVAIRMAALYLCVGAREKARFGTQLEPA